MVALVCEFHWAPVRNLLPFVPYLAVGCLLALLMHGERGDLWGRLRALPNRGFFLAALVVAACAIQRRRGAGLRGTQLLVDRTQQRPSQIHIEARLMEITAHATRVSQGRRKTIRRRNDRLLSEQGCCCSYRGRRGREEWRGPDRRSRWNTQSRHKRRNAW